MIGDSPEVAEIRIALLDEIHKKIQRVGGKALFPYNVVRVIVRADGSDAAIFERAFFRRFFEEEVRKGLTKEACRYPEELRVEVRVSETGTGKKWLLVE